MLLNPARIVIGGGISKAGDKLFVPLREELRQADHLVVARTDRRRSGRTGDDSVLYGALELVKGIIDGTYRARRLC